MASVAAGGASTIGTVTPLDLDLRRFAEDLTVTDRVVTALADTDPVPVLYRGEFHPGLVLRPLGTVVEFGPARSCTTDPAVADWFATAAWMGAGTPVRYRILAARALPVPDGPGSPAPWDTEWVTGGPFRVTGCTPRAFPHPDGDPDPIAGIEVTVTAARR